MRTQGAGNLWRIMTSNVWADVFGNPVEGRDTQLAQVYEHYLPDVLCLQEMHPNWHASRLKPQLAQRYDEVVAEQGDYALNYTPVFYRRDRLRLIGSAFHVFSGPNDFDSKSFTAAVFEPLDGGEAFAVLSTHLYYEDNDFGNRVRVQNVQEIIGFLRTLAPLRAMVCGDCNCRADSAPALLLEEQGMRSAQQIAEIASPESSWHGDPVFDPAVGRFVGKPPAQLRENSLDHIFVPEKRVKVKELRVVLDQQALDATDHSPVYADIAFC